MEPPRMKPLVSVIMPAFNAENTIVASVKSVLQQTEKKLELHIINDGSTDRTAELIDQLARDDNRVFMSHISNGGVSRARNIAINNAKGEWIAFCDADDQWFNNKLEVQLAANQNNVWSYTDSYYVGNHIQVPCKRSDQSILHSGNIFQALFQENFLTTSSLMIKREVLLEYKGFDESLSALEDWDLWLSIAKNHPIHYVEEPLLNYLVLDGSTSRRARKMLPLHKYVIEKHSEQMSQQMQNIAIAKAYTICSYIAEGSSDKYFAIECAFKAFMTKPFELQHAKRLISTMLIRKESYHA